MPTLTPQERSLRARIAAHSLHSKVDSTAHTAPARRAFLDRFETEVDPDGVLSEIERKRRAAHARKAYFTRLALASARARRKGPMRPEREPPRGGGPRGGSQQIRLAAESTPPYHLVGDEPGTLFDQQRPPHHPNPYSSRAAASVAPAIRGQRALVLDCLQEPATDDAGAARTGLELNSYRPRRAKLVEDGLVVRVGTGKSAAGNPCAVWQATAHVKSRSGGGAADLWQQILDRRPSWMSKRHLEDLLHQAGVANGADTAAALRQVLDDLEQLK
jgi:hypothetical protein